MKDEFDHAKEIVTDVLHGADPEAGSRVRRLAVDDGAFVTVYDTDDNRISGVSQMDS